MTAPYDELRPGDVLTRREAHLRALELLELAAGVGKTEAAAAAVRADLEVLPRGDLLHLAVAAMVEAALILTPKNQRATFRSRAVTRRLNVMAADL